MATSSITKDFVVSGKEQVEQFANAIEESYQDSINHPFENDVKITYLKGENQILEFLKKRKSSDDK